MHGIFPTGIAISGINMPHQSKQTFDAASSGMTAVLGSFSWKHAFTSHAALVQEQFGIAMDYDHVMELDSSTDTKFSCHLIIPLKNAAFANNSHVGAFVAGMMAHAAESDAGRALYLRKVRPMRPCSSCHQLWTWLQDANLVQDCCSAGLVLGT